MSWIAGLRPATFAGVPFYVKAQKASAGQRLVVQEIPQAEAYLFNQGKLPKQFTVTAYFLGDGWMVQRLALLAVLDKSTTAQTLVLPTLGPLNVQVGKVAYNDDEQVGAYGEVEFECVVDNGAQAPFANADTASMLLNSIDAMTAQIINAYTAVMAPISQDAAIAEYTASLLQSAASALLALPLAIVGGVSSAFAAAPSNPFATATTVSGAMLTVSDNAVAQINPVVAAPNAITGTVLATPMPADPSMGLAALAAWGGALAAPALYPATLGTAQAAVTALVRQSAALGLVALYGQTTFPNASAAQNARAQMVRVMTRVGAAIVDAGNVDLYRAWLALSTMATNDMRARAQNLPQLASYAVGASLPDVVLAQRLLRDGTQGDALAVLNDAIHPLFMPVSGLWLEVA